MGEDGELDVCIGREMVWIRDEEVGALWIRSVDAQFAWSCLDAEDDRIPYVFDEGMVGFFEDVGNALKSIFNAEVFALSLVLRLAFFSAAELSLALGACIRRWLLTAAAHVSRIWCHGRRGRHRRVRSDEVTTRCS